VDLHHSGAEERWFRATTKTRAAERFVLCLDVQGGMERDGIFELRRLW
jgi:hypothetical protein